MNNVISRSDRLTKPDPISISGPQEAQSSGWIATGKSPPVTVQHTHTHTYIPPCWTRSPAAASNLPAKTTSCSSEQFSVQRSSLEPLDIIWKRRRFSRSPHTPTHAHSPSIFPARRSRNVPFANKTMMMSEISRVRVEIATTTTAFLLLGLGLNIE